MTQQQQFFYLYRNSRRPTLFLCIATISRSQSAYLMLRSHVSDYIYICYSPVKRFFCVGQWYSLPKYVNFIQVHTVGKIFLAVICNLYMNTIWEINSIYTTLYVVVYNKYTKTHLCTQKHSYLYKLLRLWRNVRSYHGNNRRPTQSAFLCWSDNKLWVLFK